MSVLSRRRESGGILSILILLALLCYLVCFGIINFAGFERFCTTDMYEDTLIARLIWEEKTLFPVNYLFGNQFYVIATPVLAALFYGITGSMNLSMALATTLMSILIFLALNYMVKPFIKKPQIRYAALLMMAAASYGPDAVVREDGQLFFVMCSFYACYLITFFFLLGDYARARESELLRPAALAVALFLSFCTGMQSLRQTCVSMLPILCFEFLGAFICIIKKKPIWPKGKRMSLIRAASYFAANVLGVISIKLMGVTRNEIYYGQSIFNGASIRAKLSDLHEALITVSGYDFTRSGAEPFFIVFFLFTTLLIFAAFAMLVRGRNTGACAMFWWVTVIAVAAVIAASFVTSVSLRPIYLFPYYTLPALSLLVVAPRLKAKWQTIICALVLVLTSANIYYSYGKQVSLSLQEYDSPEKQVCEYAIEKGYEYIYGAHSYSSPYIAVHSDGKLIAGCWDDEILFKVSPHINIDSIYRYEDYDKALFVFLEHELDGAKSECAANGTELYFQAQYGKYHLYTSSKQLLWPLSDNIDNKWVFPEYN